MTPAAIFLLGTATSLESRPLAPLATDWRKAGIRVHAHAYDDRCADDEVERDARSALVSHCQASGISPAAIALGGFSRGARIAALVAQREKVRALLCLGFPFHRRGAPQDRHGLEALTPIEVPTLIVQGTRDAHGSREDVRGYKSLPASIQLHWLEDGNHRWVVREKSGLSDAALLRSASVATIDFLSTALHLAGDD